MSLRERLRGSFLSYLNWNKIAETAPTAEQREQALAMAKLAREEWEQARRARGLR